MTRSALDPDDRRATAAWDTAPVATGGRPRRRPRRPWVAVVALLVIGMAMIVTLRSDVLPPVPVRAPASVGAFEVGLRVTAVRATDNDRVFGRRPATADASAVGPAVRHVEAVIADYLDAAFVAPETRFSDTATGGLLHPDAMAVASGMDMTGLGVVDAAVRTVEPGPVVGTATVLTRNGAAVMVAVRYTARADTVMAGGVTGTLRQRAGMVFVPGDDGWRAAAADAELSLSDAGGRR